MWLHSKNGIYTSKSGYAIIKVNSEPLEQNFNWKACVWNIKISPKLKHLLWKIKNRAIPVGSNWMTGVFSCKRCGQPETELHLFLHWSFATNVWKQVPALHIPNSATINSIDGLFQQNLRMVSLPPTGLNEAAMFSWIMWYLWSARNKLAFEDTWLSELEIVTLEVKEARAWQSAQHHNTAPITQPIVSKLSLSTPLLKETQCFVDAAWISATCMGGFGWIFKDPTSGSTRSMSTNRSHVGSALIAEALAVKAVLLDAVSSGLTSVTFWSDSKSLISALSSKDKHIDIQGILHDISVLCRSFVSISFNYVPRLENSKADSIAKSALYVP